MNSPTVILAAVIVAAPIWYLGYQWDRANKLDELGSRCSWLGVKAADSAEEQERYAKEAFGESFYNSLAYCSALKGF